MARVHWQEYYKALFYLILCPDAEGIYDETFLFFGEVSVPKDGEKLVSS